MNELKDKYKKDFEQVQTAMNEFDPCGLIALESPVDEYDYLTIRLWDYDIVKNQRTK